MRFCFASSCRVLGLVSASGIAAVSSVESYAKTFEGTFQFRNGSSLVYEIDDRHAYQINWKSPEGETKRARWDSDSKLEVAEFTQSPAESDLGPINAMAPMTAAEERTYTWFKDSEDQFLAFDDGTIQRIAKAEWTKISARAIHHQGETYVVQSLLFKDGKGHTSIAKVNYETLDLDATFHSDLHSPSTLISVENAVLQIQGVAPRIDMGLFLPIPRVTYKGNDYEIRKEEDNSVRVTKYTADKPDGSFKVTGKITDWDPKDTIEDGMLPMPGKKLWIDLDHFSDEVRRAKRLSSFKAQLQDADRQKIDPLQFVTETFPDLVGESREKPEQFQEEIDQSLIENIAEAIYARKSPMLLGKAGTGKSISVRAFAKAVGAGKVPGMPRSTKIIEVSPYVLASGTSYVGQIELKVSAILAAARTTGWIFYFDETHSLAGTGTHSKQDNDITQYLKGALEKGELLIIGTDTEHEFYSTFGKDPAFLERFEKITIQEPAGEKLIEIARKRALADGETPPEEAVLAKAIEYSGDFDLLGAQPRAVSNLLKKLYASMAVCQGITDKAPGMDDLQKAVKSKYRVPPAFFDRCKAVELLKNLRVELDRRVIGHAQAKDAITLLWATKLAGVGDGSWVNSALFVGPQGVGKSSLAEASAFGMGYQAKTVEMSVYSNGDIESFRREIYNLLLKSPFQVIVLDEFEKAAKNVQEGALSMLQSGSFTVHEALPTGGFLTREVKAKHCLFVLTSNAAAEAIVRDFPKNSSPRVRDLNTYLEAGGISPSILSRIRQIVPMYRPSRDEFRNGIETMIGRTLELESKRAGVQFVIKNSGKTLDRLTDSYEKEGSDFRMIRRMLLSLENEIANKKLFSALNPGETVEIEWNPSEEAPQVEAWKTLFN